MGIVVIHLIIVHSKELRQNVSYFTVESKLEPMSSYFALVPTGNERKTGIGPNMEETFNPTSHTYLLRPLWLYSLYPFGSQEILLNLEWLNHINTHSDIEINL